MNSDAWLLLGAVVGVGLPMLILWIWLSHVRKIYPNESLLVLRFGKLVRRIDEPGLHFFLDNNTPWFKAVKVSRRLKATLLRDIEVHDVAGTELSVDVFVEYRVVDPVKATFAVADHAGALEKLVSHAVITELGARTFVDILRDAGELSNAVKSDTNAEAASWGIELSQILLRQVRPSPMAIEQVLGEIAARLEKVKARVEEEGRQAVALLHATTAKEVASRVSEARAQYSQAVGRAYAAMRDGVSVHEEYRQLHDLILLRPAHTVAFLGFEPGELRAADATMFDMNALASEPNRVTVKTP